MTNQNPAPTTSYELLFGDSTDELSTKVTAKLRDGWELYGEPIVVTNGNRLAATQAVVRRAKPSKLPFDAQT